jgi:hypothetical protein
MMKDVTRFAAEAQHRVVRGVRESFGLRVRYFTVTCMLNKTQAEIHRYFTRQSRELEKSQLETLSCLSNFGFGS